MDQPEPIELPQIFSVPPATRTVEPPAGYAGVWPPRPIGPTIDAVSMPMRVLQRVAGGGSPDRLRGKGELTIDTSGIAVTCRSAIPIQYFSAVILIACIWFLSRIWLLPIYLIVVGLRFVPVLPTRILLTWDQIQSIVVQQGKPWVAINYSLAARTQRTVSLVCSLTEADLQALRGASEVMAPGRVVQGKLTTSKYVYIVIAVAIYLFISDWGLYFRAFGVK